MIPQRRIKDRNRPITQEIKKGGEKVGTVHNFLSKNFYKKEVCEND